MQISRFFFMTAFFLFSSLQIFAQLAGNPENFCRNGFFPRDSETYGIGYVKAIKGERVYFYDDDRKCPTDKNCRRKNYLINKDEVLVSRTYGNYICAWYQPRKGSEIVGWLPKDKLEFPVFLSEKYTPWLGEWRYYDNNLKITKGEKDGVFKISGNAVWKGLAKSVHTGEIEAVGQLSDSDNESIIKLKQDDCEIKLDLVIYYLVVSDNMKCGGANVTFSGVYLKK